MEIILCSGPYLNLKQRSESSTSKGQYTASTMRLRALNCDIQMTK